MPDPILSYLNDPSPAQLDELRRQIRSANNFDHTLSKRSEATALLDQGQPDEALTLLMSLMPGAVLSPSTHAMLAVAHTVLADEDKAKREQFMAQLAIQSILSTGQGTEEEPWSVLRVADEYDVLSVLGREPVNQFCHRVDGKLVDRIEHPDGSATWFVVDADEELTHPTQE